jgi:hypothetical protein
VPGIAQSFDLEDVIARYGDTALLISAGSEDKWSRGADELFDAARRTLGDRAELARYDAGHVFTAPMRERAYAFLRRRCARGRDRGG